MCVVKFVEIFHWLSPIWF